VARVTYTVTTDLDPRTVWDALTEFGPRRAELWPDLSASSFNVLERGDGWARVREGTASLGIWSIERYEWTEPVITATVEEANAAQTGGTWRTEVRPRQGGGSVLTISMDRKAKGFVGHIIHGIFQLTNGQFLAARTKKMLANIRRVNAGSPG
jgi:polyketide cyclase/dehydrase/lipid transport protein